MSTTEVKRAPKAHPAYAVMITDAIRALKERSGSSGPAIKKYISSTFRGMTTGWEKHMSQALKRMTAAGTLERVKASYKLTEKAKKPATKKKPAAKKKPTSATKKKPSSATKKKPSAKKSTTATKKKPASKKPSAVKKTATKKAAAPKKKSTPAKKKE